MLSFHDRAPGARQDESQVVTALIDSINRFSAAKLDDRKIDRAHHIEPEVLSELGELGLFGLSIPENYGGAGLSLRGVCSSVEALARWDRSVAVTVGLHLGLGTRGLVAYGSEALKERYLPGLASGETIGAFATTEAGAGSDLGAIATTAKADGSELLVNGSKVYVTNGNLARIFTITAATPGLGGARRGHSLVLLEKTDAGLSLGEEEDKLGLRGSSTASLYLDEARLPLDRIVGEAGKGMPQLAHVLSWGRTVMAAGCVGAARRALERALEQVTNRVQFGKKIGAFEVIKAQIAEMAATCFAMKGLVRWASAAEHDYELLLRRSLSAKVLASEGNWDLSDLCVQLHGGGGFIEETGVAILLRDARITRIFEGANDVLLVHLGTLEATAKNARLPRAGSTESPLGAQADAIDALYQEYRKSLLDRLGVRLLGQQRALHRLGRLALLRDSADAAVGMSEEEGTRTANAHAEQWLSIAESRMRPLLSPIPAPEKTSAVAEALYAEIES